MIQPLHDNAVYALGATRANVALNKLIGVADLCIIKNVLTLHGKLEGTVEIRRPTWSMCLAVWKHAVSAMSCS